jgi:glutamate synthase (NADPH/NADH) small chain
MGKPTGFLEIQRRDRGYAPVADRIQHFREFVLPLPASEVSEQGARCMDCGIPYCHSGCPVNNLIPDWNDLVYRNRWREASEELHRTNNFPEFTGRICPAPCEAACTLNLEDIPVTIKTIECSIVDRAWEEGWIKPQIPKTKTGKKVAIVGSGPCGLACAQQLARAGHSVVVYEKNDRIGGLLRYGIPDFKLEKHHIDRRLSQMRAEGVVFCPNTHVGINLPVETLLKRYDAVVLAGGAEQPRNLEVPGRELKGIHYAMEFLTQQNRRVAGDEIPPEASISAAGKRVVVIGGGDTGSDCIGTSIRQGAISVVQLEILPKPPEKENKLLTWPYWPNKLRTSTSHEEGCERLFSVSTVAFEGKNGQVSKVRCIKVEWQQENGRYFMREIPGSEFSLEADLVLLAMGFLHPIHQGLLDQLKVELDPRGNVRAAPRHYRTSIDKVFAAGGHAPWAVFSGVGDTRRP